MDLSHLPKDLEDIIINYIKQIDRALIFQKTLDNIKKIKRYSTSIITDFNRFTRFIFFEIDNEKVYTAKIDYKYDSEYGILIS